MISSERRTTGGSRRTYRVKARPNVWVATGAEHAAADRGLFGAAAMPAIIRVELRKGLAAAASLSRILGKFPSPSCRRVHLTEQQRLNAEAPLERSIEPHHRSYPGARSNC